MPTTRINGVKIFWELTAGTGSPLALVHGSWGDHNNWTPVVPALSASFRVLTYDRRGHSQSQRPAGQGSVLEDAADLAALIEHLELRPAHIVGNSFGGSIVLRLAAERPELFRTLTVHEPPLFRLLEGDATAAAELAAVQARMAAVAHILDSGRNEDGARAFVETIAFGPGAWSQLPQPLRATFVQNAPTWLDEVRDPDALGVDLAPLRAFAAPALLTSGDQSPPFFARVVERLEAVFPNVARRTFAGAGHVPHLSHPAEYVAAITEHLRGASAS
jgi:pimeloyl-ACP methyl ester carboxylesterase